MQFKHARARAAFLAVLLVAGATGIAAPAGAANGSITQLAPTSNATTVTGSATFQDTLNVTPNDGTVVFTTTGGTGGLNVDPATGDVTTSGPLSAGTYTVTGTDTDDVSDNGNWSYQLTVGTITQSPNTTGSTTTTGSTAFSDALNVTGNSGAVTFVTSSATTGLSVSPSGAVSTTGGPLTAGVYSATGTDSDASGDSGTWSYTLTVTDTLTQTSPLVATTSTISSATFQPGSISVSGAVGPVTFVTSSPSSGLTVSSSGAISVTGPLLPNVYSVSGTDSDTNGDTGTWSYALTVDVISLSSIVQTSLTTGSTTTPDSSSFVPPALAVENNVGPVAFVTTASSTGLTVSSSGVISVTGTLAAGSYSVSGTDSDGRGDTGTWTYSLTVTDVFATVTFKSNGGSGAMASEKKDQASPLTINAFARAGYTFIDWNSAVDGSGTSYANGASYPFASNLTLYAQWKRGQLPFHVVTFVANGGRGSAALERHNTATALSPVLFIRTGYTFVDWNTAASGAGAVYAAGAVFPFTRSITLYAQWKKTPKKKPTTKTFTVTFESNGGRGAMASEQGHTGKPLLPVTFTRPGFTFTHWNTSPKGTGNDYANRASYPFTTNLTLFAQWHRTKVATPPAISGSGTIGPFSHKSSGLTSSLESQVNAIAAMVKSDHDNKITLVGYGDDLSKADQLNEALWAANYSLGQDRANAVKNYFVAELAALGVRGFTITAVGNGSQVSGTSTTTPGRYGVVVATLT